MNTPDLHQAFKDATEALYEGDSDKAAALLAQGVAAAGVVNVTAIANELERRTSQTRAIDTLFADFPEIREDGDLSALADAYVDARLRAGHRIEVAIADTGEALGQKFSLGKFKQTQAPRRSRSDNQEDVEETPQILIEEMRRERLGAASQDAIEEAGRTLTQEDVAAEGMAFLLGSRTLSQKITGRDQGERYEHDKV